jgi:predicted dehydrogenase
LGSIGLGWWGNTLADAASSSGEAEIVSCFARTAETRDTFSAKHGCRAAGSLDELLADPEVEGVVITTPHSTHRGLIEAASAAGKHVFVEKPLTNTVEDGRAAVAAANGAGVVLQVGHQRRRTAANRRIKQMIDAGHLGDIQVIETHQSVPNALKMPAEAWRQSRDESPLGGMTSLGVHKIDTATYLAGPIRSVFTFTKNTMDPSSIDQATILALEFDSGAVGTLVTSFFVPMISRVNVFGTAASAFNDTDGATLSVQSTGEMARTAVEIDPIDPIVDQLAEFARAMRGEATPETGGAEGLEVVAVMQAAVESAETNSPVAVAKYR